MPYQSGGIFRSVENIIDDDRGKWNLLANDEMQYAMKQERAFDDTLQI